MKITLPELSTFGVELNDVDPATFTAEQAAEIRSLVYEHGLVVMRDMHLGRPEYIEFARVLGRPQIYFQSNYHHPEHPEIFVSSNVPENGKKVGVAGTGRFWHTDYSFFDEPLSMTMVYPQVFPKSGRQTLYIDMHQVLEKLPTHLREAVEGKRAFHEATWYYKIQPKDIDRAIAELVEEFKQLSPGATHPMVITHPVTGKQSLYVSSGFTTAIEGLGHEEGRALLAELFAFAERPEHVRSHEWREGDILLWDNRGLIHRAAEGGSAEASVSYRIGVYDELPFYVS